MLPDVEWLKYSSPLAASLLRRRGRNTRDESSSSDPGLGNSTELGWVKPKQHGPKASCANVGWLKARFTLCGCTPPLIQAEVTRSKKGFCANVEWLKAGFTLYGCNASSCEMADVFIATGREPSEKARPDTHEMIAQVPNLAWVARQSSVDLG